MYYIYILIPKNLSVHEGFEENMKFQNYGNFCVKNDSFQLIHIFMEIYAEFLFITLNANIENLWLFFSTISRELIYHVLKNLQSSRNFCNKFLMNWYRFPISVKPNEVGTLFTHNDYGLLELDL